MIDLFSYILGKNASSSGGSSSDKYGYPAVTAKVADYIYKGLYGELDYDNAYEYFKSHGDFPTSACSTVRKDNYIGRNLDWFYSNQAEFIIKTQHTIGFAGGISEFTKTFVESGAESELYKILPFQMMDGINDSGVFACYNVVPTDYGKNVVEPTGEQQVEINAIMLVRYILDNFTSATDAVNFIQQHAKVYFSTALHDMNYELHLMVADTTKTYDVEFIDGATEVIDISNTPWITNFHRYDVTFNSDMTVTTPEDGDAVEVNNISLHGSGLERWNLIVNAYDTDELKTIMTDLYSTRMYSSSPNVASPAWYSEFTHDDLTLSSPLSDFVSYAALADAEYVSRDRNDPKTWQTTHSVIYNMSDLSLSFRVQEESDEYFEYIGINPVVNNQDKTIIQNGVYEADEGYTGLGTVTVNVPSEEPVLDTLSVTENGTYTPPSGTDGYDEVVVNVPSSDPILDTLNVTSNGTYTPPTGVDGYDEVIVNVPEDNLDKFLRGELKQITTTATIIPAWRFTAAYKGNGYPSEKYMYTKITAPNATEVWRGAFYGQRSLTEVTLSNNCVIGGDNPTDLSSDIFYNCQSLNKINGKITLLSRYNWGNYAPKNFFNSCGSLKWNSLDWSGIECLADSFLKSSGIDEFDFRYIQTVTGEAQFQYCTALKTVNIRNLSGLAKYMFNRCTGLTNIYIEKTDAVVTVGSYALENVPTTCNVHVPASMLVSYQANNTWNKFNLIGDSEPPVMLMAKKGGTDPNRRTVDEDGSPIYYND